MVLPPLVIDVSVRERGARNFRIWFPFVLLWPVLFVLVGFALVVTLLVDLVLLLAGSRYHHYTALLLGAMHMLADMRGTSARVDSATTFVAVEIY